MLRLPNERANLPGPLRWLHVTESLHAAAVRCSAGSGTATSRLRQRQLPRLDLRPHCLGTAGVEERLTVLPVQVMPCGRYLGDTQDCQLDAVGAVLTESGRSSKPADSTCRLGCGQGVRYAAGFQQLVLVLGYLIGCPSAVVGRYLPASPTLCYLYDWLQPLVGFGDEPEADAGARRRRLNQPSCVEPTCRCHPQHPVT